MKPTKEDQPGHLFERTTSDQAQRTDLDAYRARATKSAREDPLRIAVIGAGLSGLFAARVLADHGLDVQVYEKSRGTGGRLATRRVGDQAFDIGAQYFTARDDRFLAYVDAWLSHGLVRVWQGRIAALNRAKDHQPEHPIRRFVGVPHMTAVSRHLATDLNTAFETRITGVERKGSAWQLSTDTGQELGSYDAVIIATPSVQAVPLLAEAPHLATQAAAGAWNPCWAVMATFKRPLPLTSDGVFLNSPELDWAARNSSKPGRPPGESWVIHATAAWSEAHLEADAGPVATEILEHFFATTETQACDPDYLQAHRWRYAKVRDPLTAGCLWDPVLKIGACGDWSHGSRVEGAVLSGMAIAGRVLGLSD